MWIELAYQQLAARLSTLYEKREAATIANWVIEDVTGLKRMDRIIQKNKVISSAELADLKEKTDQLLASKPVQYVLEEAWFSAMPFYVNESVLIPRPETEELIEWVVTENKERKFKQILDIGTGSGCIPITLKKKLQDAAILSIDISNEALKVAEKNASHLSVSIELKQR